MVTKLQYVRVPKVGFLPIVCTQLPVRGHSKKKAKLVSSKVMSKIQRADGLNGRPGIAQLGMEGMQCPAPQQIL